MQRQLQHNQSNNNQQKQKATVYTIDNYSAQTTAAYSLEHNGLIERFGQSFGIAIRKVATFH